MKYLQKRNPRALLMAGTLALFSLTSAKAAVVFTVTGVITQDEGEPHV